MNKYIDTLTKGIFKENTVFVMLLGLCPTLGVTTSSINGLAMGLATLSVVLFSNIIVSLIRKLIPNGVRIPVYIVVIASLVTVVEMLMHAYVPALYESLGLFIPLIVVNCMILGRAESFASKNNVRLSILDALGAGIGFTLSLLLIGSIRELLGKGSVFDMRILPSSYDPALIFLLAPGGFLTIGLIIAFKNYFFQLRSKGEMI